MSSLYCFGTKCTLEVKAKETGRGFWWFSSMTRTWWSQSWTHPLFSGEATASGLTHFEIHIHCHFQSPLWPEHPRQIFLGQRRGVHSAGSVPKVLYKADPRSVLFYKPTRGLFKIMGCSHDCSIWSGQSQSDHLKVTQGNGCSKQVTAQAKNQYAKAISRPRAERKHTDCNE